MKIANSNFREEFKPSNNLTQNQWALILQSASLCKQTYPYKDATTLLEYEYELLANKSTSFYITLYAKVTQFFIIFYNLTYSYMLLGAVYEFFSNMSYRLAKFNQEIYLCTKIYRHLADK